MYLAPGLLISDFVICLLESIISKLAKRDNFNFLASLCNCTVWFESSFIRNPEGVVLIWVMYLPLRAFFPICFLDFFFLA